MNIAEYNIDIEYLPGKQNLIADLMSRRPNNHEPDEGEVPQQVTSHKVNVIDSSKFDPTKYVNAELPLLDLDEKPKLIDLDTYDEQQKDDSIVQLIKNLDTGKLSKSLEKSLKNLRQAKRRNARYANENAKDVKLEVGDSVYLKQHVRKSKLDRKWQPFYRIVSQKSPYTFVIRNQLNGSIKESHVRHFRLANIDDWEITKEDKERQMRKARMVVSPDNSDSEPEAEPPLAKLTKMKRRHRSGSSSEEDIPLLELQNRIKARNRQLKREYANRNVSSSTDSSSEPDLKTRRSVHNDDSSLEGKYNQDQTLMHYDSETDEYYTDVGSTVPKQESMEVDQVNSVDNNQKEQVKQILSAVIGLLK